MLPPRAARESDLVERFWPKERHVHGGIDPPPKPNLGLQLSLAPAGCFANFRLAPGGASTWVHVVSGQKVHRTICSPPLDASRAQP